MQDNEELKIINQVCIREQRGVQVTRKKLVDLSDMNFIFIIGYVLAGLGVLMKNTRKSPHFNARMDRVML